MKIHLYTDGQKITGTLTSTFEKAFFVSDDNKTRLIIIEPKYLIGGEEDSNTIWIKGYERVGFDTLKEINYTCLPIV